MNQDGQRKWQIKPLRRMVQLAVLGGLVAIPFLSQNSMSLPPSRIVLRQMPQPALFPVSGDTWTLTLGSMDFTHPVAAIEAIFAAKVLYVPLLVSAIFPLAMTIILGRIFCSWLCPVGFLLELNNKVTHFLSGLGMNKQLPKRDFRFPVLTISLVFSFLFAFPVMAAFDPPHLLGRELMYFATHQQVCLFGVSFLAAIFLLEMFSTSRFWCRFICPSGAGLALLGRWRLWRISMADNCIDCGRCDLACPYQLAPMGLVEGKKFDWLTCDNCGLCRDSCPVGTISYSISINDHRHHVGNGGG